MIYTGLRYNLVGFNYWQVTRMSYFDRKRGVFSILCQRHIPGMHAVG